MAFTCRERCIVGSEMFTSSGIGLNPFLGLRSGFGLGGGRSTIRGRFAMSDGDNVVRFTGDFYGDINPDDMLAGMAEECRGHFARIIVIGVTPDGHTVPHLSDANLNTSIADLARASMILTANSMPDDDDLEG